jgi:translation initiation factor 2 subunit 2
MTLTYEQLLERALEKVPKKTDTGERFAIPKSQVQPDGAKTIIVNFSEMASALARDEAHMLKFLLKELATSGDIKNKRATVLGRFNNMAVDKKIELYVNQYVICKECGRPDTHMLKEDRMSFVKCDACGGKTFVKSIQES